MRPKARASVVRGVDIGQPPQFEERCTGPTLDRRVAVNSMPNPLVKRLGVGSTVLALLVVLSSMALAPGMGVQADPLADWPNLGRDAGHSGFTPDSPLPPLEQKWQVQGVGVSRASAPVLASNKVLVTADESLTAYDAFDGHVVWSFEVPDTDVTNGLTWGPPAVTEGKVFFYAGNPYCCAEWLRAFIYALDLDTGEVLWKRQSSIALLEQSTSFGRQILAYGDRVYFSGSALDAATGETVWDADFSGGVGNTIPAADGVRVYGIDQAHFQPYVGVVGTLSAVNIADGTVAWRSTAPMANSTPLVTNGSVYVSSIRTLTAVDGTNGNIRWQVEIPVRGGLASGGTFQGYLAATSDTIVAMSDNGLYAFDAVSGAVRWLRDVYADGYVAPTIAGGTVWGAGQAGAGSLAAIDLDTGATVWTSTSPGVFTGAPPIVDGPWIYALIGGTLASFESTTSDSDGDGVPDDEDNCPDEPEDLDGVQDEDGCPDYLERAVVFVQGIDSQSLNPTCGAAVDGFITESSVNRVQPLVDAIKDETSFEDENFFYFSYAGRFCDRDFKRPVYGASDTCGGILGAAGLLDNMIGTIAERNPGVKFDIVAHSMGGVVATYWASDDLLGGPDVAAGRVNSIVTFDSPLRGTNAQRPGSACENEPSWQDLFCEDPENNIAACPIISQIAHVGNVVALFTIDAARQDLPGIQSVPANRTTLRNSPSSMHCQFDDSHGAVWENVDTEGDDPVLCWIPAMTPEDDPATFEIDEPVDDAKVQFVECALQTPGAPAGCEGSFGTQIAGQTATTASAPAGTTELAVGSTDGLATGDSILINPGMANEEENKIIGFASIVLATPLQFDHEPGEPIHVLPDTDADGVPDIHDGCTDELEDVDGFEDSDGCPDPDNDGDGIIDTVDACPDESEDMDVFQDGDGCPEPCPGGDVNGDGHVNFSDLVLVTKAFGSRPGDRRWNPSADINHNGRIDLGDLITTLRSSFDPACQPAA